HRRGRKTARLNSGVRFAMKVLRFVAVLTILAVAACSRTATTPVAADPASKPSIDRQKPSDICFREFAVTCDKLPHLLGPVNAQSRGETEACFNNHIQDLIGDNWIIRTGNIYCLAAT